jgi:hypothetical protein
MHHWAADNIAPPLLEYVPWHQIWHWRHIRSDGLADGPGKS